MATLKEEAYASNYYVPRKRSMAWGIMIENHAGAASLTSEDSNTVGRDGIVIVYKGNAPRQSYAGYAIVKCDIGTVGAKFVDVAITEVIGHNILDEKLKPTVGPVRFGIHSMKFYLKRSINNYAKQ